VPRKQAPVPPTCFVPSCPADFVGQAGKVAEVLLRKAERLRTNPDQPLKLLITGAPGIGKTCLVNLIARTLTSHPVAIEDVNGKEVGLELAREWTRSIAYGSIFGSWSVKVVNELDRCSKDALDMLLTYLDRMKPGHAFLGTTNLDLGSLTERFQTRFQSVRLQPPENEVLAAFLARRWGAPITSPVRSPRAQKATSGPHWRIWRCGWGRGSLEQSWISFHLPFPNSPA
jgi:replication-associated recombination protein RarA